MKVFGRILHATDFSGASRPAFRRALALARQNGAQLSIAYVIPPPPVLLVGDGFVSPGVAPGIYDEIERGARQRARKQLDALVSRARRDGARVKGLLLDGVPHEQILRAARRTRTDLIVIGTHGRSGVSKLLLGSVAERVIRLATCPVLTVRSR